MEKVDIVIEMENGDVMKGEVYPEVAPIMTIRLVSIHGETSFLDYALALENISNTQIDHISALGHVAHIELDLALTYIITGSEICSGTSDFDLAQLVLILFRKYNLQGIINSRNNILVAVGIFAGIQSEKD